MQYYTYKCPYCNKVVSRENSLTKDSSGCPLRVCPNCGKTYIDTNCDEPALRPYKPFGAVACIATAVAGGCFAGFGALLLIFAIGYFSGWYSVTSFHVWVSVAIGVAYCVFSFLFRYSNLKKENAPQKIKSQNNRKYAHKESLSWRFGGGDYCNRNSRQHIYCAPCNRKNPSFWRCGRLA